MRPLPPAVSLGCLEREDHRPRVGAANPFRARLREINGKGGHVFQVKTTRYFEEQVLRKRPYIRREWCAMVLASPLRREVQADGRVRHWGFIAELGNRALRVVTLEDGETVHNAFPDRQFQRE